MDSKEAIIKAATELIEERGERLGSVTVREIGKRAGVGLGLVNYHFGNKDELIAQCVEKIINGIVARFVEMRERTEGMLPPEKLESLVQMTDILGISSARGGVPTRLGRGQSEACDALSYSVDAAVFFEKRRYLRRARRGYNG